MAEAILKEISNDRLEVYSAGSHPCGYVHPKAIEAMQEIGCDISHYESKSMQLFVDKDIDTVITVCSNAKGSCELLPGDYNHHHWEFDDPPKAIQEGETELDAFRRIRNQIQLVFSAYVAGLQQGTAS